MQERKQAVILFQSNEKYNGFQYDAGKHYLIQDIPKDFIAKWLSYGHVLVKKTEDIDVLEDARSKEYIKADYDAMVARDKKREEGREKEKLILSKKNTKPRNLKEEKVEEVVKEEVESVQEEIIEEKDAEIEKNENDGKKASKKKNKKNNKK